jgi:hypothetical protein
MPPTKEKREKVTKATVTRSFKEKREYQRNKREKTNQYTRAKGKSNVGGRGQREDEGLSVQSREKGGIKKP